MIRLGRGYNGQGLQWAGVTMRERLVEKLCAFHLSPNQAKVYAYLCEVNAASISDIVEATEIYAQDVYKDVTALGKKGLVLKTKTQPFIIEAIPAERALRSLINLIENNSIKEIRALKKYYKEILIEKNNALRNIEAKKDNKGTVFVLEKQAPESRIDMAFDNLIEEYDCIQVEGVVNYGKLDVDYGRLQFKKIAKRGVKIKMLILGREISLARVEATRKMMPKNNYEIRTLTTKDFVPAPLALIDSNELWLSIPSVGKEDALILTDVKEMIEIAKHLFEALWNDPNAKVEAKGSPNGKAVEQILTS
jgi:sugar-specific transcriptional regulator TrmB